MAKIKYQSDGFFAQTPCPYGIKLGSGVVMVNSHACAHTCKYYRSTDRKEKTVICLADCSFALEKVVDKIDFVIANNKFDDICFEDFLSEIREDIAKILDGTKEESK